MNTLLISPHGSTKVDYRFPSTYRNKFAEHCQSLKKTKVSATNSLKVALPYIAAQHGYLQEESTNNT